MAPITEPATNPNPPRTTMARKFIDKMKVNNVGLMNPRYNAHKEPAQPANSALNPKLYSLYRLRFTPIAEAAISLSRMA